MKKINPLIWSGVALALLATALAVYLWNQQQESLSQDWRRLAEAKTNQQKIELAERILARYRWLLPEQRSAVRAMLAAAYEGEGRRQEMERVYLEMLAEDPADHQALNNIAYQWSRRGENLDSAQAFSLRAVGIALEKLPREKPVAMSDEGWQEMLSLLQATYLDTYGWVLYKKAQYDSSLQVLKKAWGLAQDPTIAYHYGLALLQKGQLDSAIARLATAVAAKTEDSLEAREELKGIYYQRYRSLAGLEAVVAAAWENLEENRVRAMAVESGKLVGSPAPDFSLKDLYGQRHTLSEARGRVVVLDFWAQWCAPCRIAMPLVQKVWQQYREQPVTVWGINLDDLSNLDQAKKFLSQESINLTVLLGGQMGRGVDRAYQVTGIPTTLVIDKKGVIRFRHIGYRENLDELLAKNIESLLKEP